MERQPLKGFKILKSDLPLQKIQPSLPYCQILFVCLQNLFVFCPTNITVSSPFLTVSTSTEVRSHTPQLKARCFSAGAPLELETSSQVCMSHFHLFYQLILKPLLVAT